MAAFIHPRKVILSKEQLAHFQQSKTHADILSYVEDLNEAVVGVKLTAECTVSPVRPFSQAPRPLLNLQQGVQAILDVLDKVEQIAKDIPPVDNKASRFGNPAFKAFYDKVTEVRGIMHLLSMTAHRYF